MKMGRTKQVAQGKFRKGKSNPLNGPKGQMVVNSALAGGTGVKPVPPKHRYRPGTVSLREIRQFQKRTEPLMRKRPFSRLVCESGQLILSTARYERHAVDALQRITEGYTVRLVEDAMLCALHAKRVTLQAKDLILARWIRENIQGPFFYARSKMSSDEQKKRDAALTHLAERTVETMKQGGLWDAVKYV